MTVERSGSAGRAVTFTLGWLQLELVPPGTEAGPHTIAVSDPAAAADALGRAVTRAPVAARTLADVLEVTSAEDVHRGLLVESLAYSMLLAGSEFREWLDGQVRREVPVALEPELLVERVGACLDITLNRAARHNAFNHRLRDGLCEALDLVALDVGIGEVHLRGNGPSFCSGGDLDEFGTTPDVALAHSIRTEQSVAARIEAVRSRVSVHLHGAAIGAGIELASFAARVTAEPATVIRLPELDMGLIPGAGGTVGVCRRIGPWRTAYLVLSGAPLPVATAHSWGLVDVVAP